MHDCSGQLAVTLKNSINCIDLYLLDTTCSASDIKYTILPLLTLTKDRPKTSLVESQTAQSSTEDRSGFQTMLVQSRGQAPGALLLTDMAGAVSPHWQKKANTEVFQL